jgi:hypothetical protein
MSPLVAAIAACAFMVGFIVVFGVLPGLRARSH